MITPRSRSIETMRERAVEKEDGNGPRGGSGGPASAGGVSAGRWSVGSGGLMGPTPPIPRTSSSTYFRSPKQAGNSGSGSAAEAVIAAVAGIAILSSRHEASWAPGPSPSPRMFLAAASSVPGAKTIAKLMPRRVQSMRRRLPMVAVI